ncbi:MAG: bifunctional riboflavin kinase/FAD synthetase [Bacteriovoracaceae bacterium]
MKVVSHLNDIKNDDGSVPIIGMTIGNFDGVHKGHRYLLQTVKKSCELKKIKFAVMTFVPHPHQILSTNFRHYLLNSYEDRRKMLAEIGVDYLVEIDFNRDFSTMKPEQFLENYLFVYPQLLQIHLGHDFAFGMNKEGTFNLVKKIGAQKKIEVIIEDEFKDGAVVSSSAIRELVREGKMPEAAGLLDRNFFLNGRVIKGEGRGKKIGFPTANLQLDSDILLPRKGVYITKTFVRGMVFQSITNVGKNPTFNDEEIIHVETNLLDFDQDIYGETIKVSFLGKIRDEKKFESVNKLIEQLKLDVSSAKSFFA